MPISTAKYLGDLRIECTHLQSGGKILVDAPTDNHGKGEAFSPTDLFCTSLACCAMNIIGVYAQENDLDVSGMSAEISKSMAQNPRRVGAVEVVIFMPDREYSQWNKMNMENGIKRCPVALSLNPDVKLDMRIEWRR